MQHVVKDYLTDYMKAGNTIFLSTHILEVAEEICSDLRSCIKETFSTPVTLPISGQSTGTLTTSSFRSCRRTAMFELFIAMVKEEWRVHSTMFGSLSFALFPGPHLLDRVHGLVPSAAHAPGAPAGELSPHPPRKLPDARLYGRCVWSAGTGSDEPPFRAGKPALLFGTEPAALGTVYLCQLCRQRYALLLCPLGAPARARVSACLALYRHPGHPAALLCLPSRSRFCPGSAPFFSSPRSIPVQSRRSRQSS